MHDRPERFVAPNAVECLGIGPLGRLPRTDAGHICRDRRIRSVIADAEPAANVYLEVINLSDETRTESHPGVVEEAR